MSVQFVIVIVIRDHASSIVQFHVGFIHDHTFFSLIYRGIIAIIAVQMRNALSPSTTARIPN